jgi:hypothetical protein
MSTVAVLLCPTSLSGSNTVDLEPGPGAAEGGEGSPGRVLGPIPAHANPGFFCLGNRSQKGAYMMLWTGNLAYFGADGKETAQ